MCCADEDTAPHSESASLQPMTPSLNVQSVLGGMPVVSIREDWPANRRGLVAAADWHELIKLDPVTAEKFRAEIARLDTEFNYTGS